MNEINSPGKSKILTAAAIGNILEFYDFTLYATFAPKIAPLFFPHHDPLTSLILTFGVFAIGFCVRPLGAIIFGHIGDRMGRKKSLSFSIALMSLPTFLIGIIPTYASIGIYAPILIMMCRILQGLCAGGEFNGSALFVLEQVHPQQRGFYGGLLISTCVSGTIIATLVGIAFNHYNFPEEAWRLAFIFGAVIGIIGIYIRRRLTETPAFQDLQNKGLICKTPLFEVFKHNKKALLCMLGVGGLNGAVIYTIFGYSPTYLTKLGYLSSKQALYSSLFGLLALIICSPIFGKISDRYGAKNIMYWASLSVMAFSWPYYYILSSNTFQIIILGQMVMGIIGAAYVGSQHSFSYALFPTADRYSGNALGYSLGMALLGGTTPMVSTFLIERTSDYISPFYWLMLCAMVALLTNLMSKRLKDYH